MVIHVEYILAKAWRECFPRLGKIFAYLIFNFSLTSLRNWSHKKGSVDQTLIPNHPKLAKLWITEEPQDKLWDDSLGFKSKYSYSSTFKDRPKFRNIIEILCTDDAKIDLIRLKLAGRLLMQYKTHQINYK